MWFKIWDMVRPTREYFINLIEDSDVKHLEYPNWFQIIKIDGNKIYYDNEGFSFHRASDLELVTEEPEFKRWEIVEVWSNAEGRRVKRIFVCEAIWAKYPYICVSDGSQEEFMNWKPFLWAEWDKIRKPKWKLTRKEIAEKFWVAEDFELIEE